MSKGLKGTNSIVHLTTLGLWNQRNAKFLDNGLINGSDQSWDLVSMRYQSSTSSNRLVIIYNTPQVQTSPQAVDDILVDEVVMEIP